MVEMARTAADIDMRARLRQLGVRLITEAVLRESLLVRDLINTPTEHMGPDELEQVSRELATELVANAGVVVAHEGRQAPG